MLTLSIYFSIRVIWRLFTSLQKEFLQVSGGEEDKGDGAGTEMMFDLPAGLAGKTDCVFFRCAERDKGSPIAPLSQCHCKSNNSEFLYVCVALF